MKYTIPRNRQIPDASFADVLNSGALAKDNAGKAEGDYAFAYRGNDVKLPKSDFISLGKVFPFRFGLVFIPEKTQGLDEHVTETISAAATLVLGALPKMVLDAATKTPNPGAAKSASAATSGSEVIAKLTKHGALCLPGVDLVEVEHIVVPGGFLRKASHHCILTYENNGGQRATYTFAVFAATAERWVNATVTCVLKSRAVAEFDYLAGAVKSDHLNADPIWASQMEHFKTRFGADWVNHIDELSSEVKKVADAELEGKGFTAERAMAEILNRIGPLIPYYQAVPQMKDLVTSLEQASRGGAAGSAK